MKMNRASVTYGTISSSLTYMKVESQQEKGGKRRIFKYINANKNKEGKQKKKTKLKIFYRYIYKWPDSQMKTVYPHFQGAQ